MVVRTPQSSLDDVVPARRPITVLDLLTGCAGYGWPSDFSYPQVQALFEVQTDGRQVQRRPAPDEWLARLARLPLLYQPGEAWLYDTCSDLQGILVARAGGQTLPEFLAERIFAPLGMRDTAFVGPTEARPLHQLLPPRGERTRPRRRARRRVGAARPRSRKARVASRARLTTCWRFARMLLADGAAVAFARIGAADDDRSPDRRPTRDRRALPGGPGLGFRRLGRHRRGRPLGRTGPLRLGRGHRYVGAHRAEPGSVAILLTQVGADSPVPSSLLSDFWELAART